MSQAPVDIDHLRQWIGRSTEREEVVAPTPIEGLAALLDYSAPPWPAGQLPTLGRWLAFLPSAPQSDLGADGHPRLGGFLPPIPLPRRMWAGAQVEVIEPLRLMTPLCQTTTIADVAQKRGGSGDFIRVTLRYEVFEGHRLAVREHQDLIYRPAADETQATPTAGPPPSERGFDYERSVSPDPSVSVFRPDLQCPPHPLRSRFRARRRALSGPCGAWAAAGHVAAGSLSASSCERPRCALRLPRPAPALRGRAFQAEGARHRKRRRAMDGGRGGSDLYGGRRGGEARRLERASQLTQRRPETRRARYAP